MKKFVACLAIFVVYATIASADPNRPRPQQVPPRPPHPRLRREADPGVRTSLPKPTPHPRIRREADAEVRTI
ncbi:apidaecins type 14-like isoform X2 [Cephus cinctus]|uniref:Apidaecins type 14-like isoform X2 n=1 Tax=Cephus cinctus TaxID=211228 RepID=A0AAJ7RH47_CEPCN|nr:apidaecins type 14-like isoform X2 [Cephus cinctus]